MEREIRQFDCFSGLRYKVMPIIHEGRILGRVIFGPYAPDTLKEAPSALEVHKDKGLDLKILNDYQKSIPRASEETAQRVLGTLGIRRRTTSSTPWPRKRDRFFPLRPRRLSLPHRQRSSIWNCAGTRVGPRRLRQGDGPRHQDRLLVHLP